jgi:uncharacterized repeat protein (TIGR01451 family)
MENKKLKWIITACVIILIAILAVLGYIYKDKITGLFSGASNPTLDWGGARQELNQELPCLAPVQTQPGSTFTFDTEQRFKLYNHTNDRATNVKVNVSSDNASLIASSAVSVSSGSYSNGVWTIPTIEPGAWQYIRFQKSGVSTQPFSLVVSGGEGSLGTSCRTQDFIRFVEPTITPSPTPNPNPGPGPIDSGLPDVQPTDSVTPAPIKADLGGTGDVKGVTTFAQNSLRKNNSGSLIEPINPPTPGSSCATTLPGLRTLAASYRVLKNEAVVSILGEGCATFTFTIFRLGQNQEVLPFSAQTLAETKTVSLGTGTHYIKLDALPCSFQSDLYLPGSTDPLAYDWLEHGCGTTPPPPTLTCAPANQTIKAGESATFTATGGNGTYTWSTTGDNPTKPPTGSSATFTYGTAGTYTVTVSSKDAQQVEKTATCNVTVTALPAGQTLTCSPATQNAQTGRSVSFTSTYSGQGLSYIWSAPEGTPTNGPGNNFQTTFSTVGTKTVTVTVGGETASCTVIVTASPVALTCSPSTQSIEINKEVTVTASGGNGTYAWTALQGNPPSGTGASFKTTFSAPTAQGAPREIKVTSGSEQKICTVTVNDVTTTQQQADLKVTKTVSNATPLLNGPNFTYTITLSNLGPNNATGISLRDVLPTAVTYISSTASQGTYNPTDGVWTVGALNVNAEATLQITGKANAVGTHPNTATITGSSLPDPNPNNNESTATIVVGTGGCTSNCGGGSTGVDIGVTKSVSNSSPTLNSSIQFTVTATNNGPNAATGVTLRDLLPSQVTYVSNTPSVGTYNSTTGIWTIGSMSVGAQASLQFNVTVNATGSSTNIVTLNTVDQTDSNSANNQAQASITVSAGCTVNCGGGGGGGSVGADLAVTKTVSNTMPSVGQNIVYTIGVYNNGGQNATNVVLRDILPSGIQYVSSSANQGSYSQATGLWTVGSLNIGASAQLQITGTVTVTGTIINTAQVSSLDQTDSNSSNNQASATIVVGSSGGSGADIAVNKTASNDTPAVGGQVTFTINVVNRGPNNAGNVTISDVLPSQVKFLKVQASQGSYDKNTGIWTIGSLANGASAVLQITVTVLKVDNITNLARVNTSDQPDPDTTNNQSQVTITSHAAPGLPAAGINTAASITIGFLFILLAIVIRFLGSTKQQLVLADDSRKIVTKTRFD